MQIRNGAITAYNGITDSGSVTITGSVTTTTGFTGSLFGTSSWAENALTSNPLIEKTKAQIDTLIGSNQLVPGQLYKITGVDTALYGGTDIIIKAATTSELELAGHGIFYNPKYLNSQATPENGYGIWTRYFPVNITNITGGTFNTGDTLTANNGATATWLSNGLLEWISGDWSLATNVDNGGGVTADISLAGLGQPGFPSYAIGDDAIWGGKHWTNTSGNVGTATDKYTLSGADWTAVAFNSTDYNVVADVIHYDYEHDMIIRRKDKWDNDVDGNFQVFDEFIQPFGYGYGNPIKDFQWGNGPEDWNVNDYYYLGVTSNYVKDSYLDCLNFIGEYLWSNRLQVSSITNTITDVFSSLSYNNLSNSYFNNNILSRNSNINFNDVSYMSNISDNKLSLSQMMFNNISNNSNIQSNNLLDSLIEKNELSSNSSISSNNLNGGGVQSSTLIKYSNIQSNTITNSNINTNILTDNSTIYENILSSSLINSNTLNSSIFNFSSSGTLTSKTIQYIQANYANATFNISTATIIYGDYSKQMFRNSSGVTRLGYYNASDVFTVVNVNA